MRDARSLSCLTSSRPPSSDDDWPNGPPAVDVATPVPTPAVMPVIVWPLSSASLGDGHDAAAKERQQTRSPDLPGGVEYNAYEDIGCSDPSISVVPGVGSALDCQDRCTALAQCFAFTYNTGTEWCFLKQPCSAGIAGKENNYSGVNVPIGEGLIFSSSLHVLEAFVYFAANIDGSAGLLIVQLFLVDCHRWRQKALGPLASDPSDS